MKKFFLRTTSIVCAFAMVLSVSACGTKSKDVKKDNTAQEKPAEKVVFNIYKNAAIPEYPSDGGRAKKMILEKAAQAGITNFDYNVTLIGGKEYFDKLNILAASNQLPDYFMTNIDTLTRFADQGLIQKLDGYLKNMPLSKKMMRQNDLDALTYKDALYAFPVGYRAEPINGSNTRCLILRQDWLDNVGLKAPTTIDELYNVLKAFKTKDPDKNGKDDTSGYVAEKATIFDPIMGAFGVIPNFWFERDGMLKHGSVLPEIKDALAVLQKWYTEGLIDPDVFTTDAKLAEQKFVNSKLGVYEATAFTANPNNPDYAALLKATPSAKVTAILPPKGPSGKQGLAEVAPGYANIYSISSKCKNAELLCKFLNWMSDDSATGGFYLITYGVEGEHYTYDKDKNTVSQKVDYSVLYKDGFSNPVRFLQIVDRRWMVPEALTAMEAANKYFIPNKYWGVTPGMKDYPDLFGTNAKIYSEYMSKIITGSLPVSAYDDYVKKFYQQGGKIVEEQVNAEYKKLKK